MMLCADYKRMLLADPQNPSAEMRLHVAVCADCTRYTERLLRFEGRLDRALRVTAMSQHSTFAAQSAPLRAAAAPFARPVRRRNRWLAAAASVLVAAVVAGGLWLVAPGRSLAAAVVDHMSEEPQAWTRTDVPVAPPRLDKVLGKSHVRLRADAGLVSYANSCLFRGQAVPHLVVQTAGGPVTVMVLTHESVFHSMHFNEQGYRGVIVRVPGHGSLAVLERGDSMDIKAIDAIAAQVRGAIDWTA
jgi:hypothetical protein